MALCQGQSWIQNGSFVQAINVHYLFGRFCDPTWKSYWKLYQAHYKNTNVEQKELKEIWFPLFLKICVRPGFNKTAIQNAGYTGAKAFFFCQSMFNR